MMSVLHFAELINCLTGNQADIVLKPLPQEDPHWRQLDISKA